MRMNLDFTKGELAMFLIHSKIGCLAITALLLSSSATAQANNMATGSWSIEENPAPIPMNISTNVLYNLQPYCATNNNAAWNIKEIALLTDNNISVATADNTRFIKNNSAIYWDLTGSYIGAENGLEIANIRIFSSYSNKDRCQIRLAKICIKQKGNDEWIELENSNVTGPIGAKTYKGTFSSANGASLAQNVTHLMIDFGPSQQNSYAHYSEIEVGIVPNANLKRKITLNYASNLGSATVNPASTTMEFPITHSITLNATPLEGMNFVGWYGDVPGGRITDNPLIIPIDKDKTINAVFEKNCWEWADGTMSDGLWTLTTTSTSQGLRITKATTTNADLAPIVNLRKPIIGTDAVPTEIAGSVFKTKTGLRDILFADSITSLGQDACRQTSTLKEVQLPANLQTIGHCCFYGCTSLQKIYPLFPDSLQSFENMQNFSKCPIVGELVINNPDFTGGLGTSIFSEIKVTKIDLSKSGISSIGSAAFDTARNLTEVYLPSSLTSLGNQTFIRCSALNSVYFESKPATIGNNIFETLSSYKTRIVVYNDDDDWMNFFETDSTFTAFEDLNASNQAKYTFNDKCVPYGAIKFSSVYVFVATRKRPSPPGTLLLLK